MATEVRMPKMGMSMESGTLVEWHRQAGDEVVEGEVIAEISSDKIESEVTAPASGVLGEPAVAEGEEVAVGAVLALIGAAGQAPPPAPSEAVGAEAAEPAPAEADPKPAPEQPRATAAGAASRPKASPAARRVARELGVDLAEVAPTASGDRITSEDVRKAAEGVDEAAATGVGAGHTPRDDGEAVPFRGIRAVVAKRMAESVRSTAQVTVTREANASGLVARRADLLPGIEEATGARLTYTDLLVEAVARLLGEHPRLNATLDGDGVRRHRRVAVGVAVALEDGLIVPVIHDVQAKSLEEIVRARVDLAERARVGDLAAEEVADATFTITNLGGFGTDVFTPILNLPQVAILGVGRIAERAVAVDGDVIVRPTVWLSLTVDHRAVDGAPAAAFLHALAGAWDDPG